MSSPDDRPVPTTPTHAEGDDAAEQLLAVSAELGDTDQEAGWRARSGTVRRRQRVVRGTTPPEPDHRERIKVRTVTEEGVEGRAPTGSGPTATPVDVPEPAGEPVMLDAQGVPITEAAQAAATAATAASAGTSQTDAGRYLADAVRSYLDGVADLGADHAVTQDRLTQLRRTLERYEQSH